LFGEAAKALPSVVTLAKIDVAAGYSSRVFSIDATITDLINFPIGNLNISLKEIAAGARFTQSGNSFYLRGLIGFGSKVADETDFDFSLEGAYNAGIWSFAGYLSRGEVNIGSLVRDILGLSITQANGELADAHFDIRLTAFSVNYQYKSGRAVNPFSLKAAFAVGASWGNISDMVQINAGGLVALATDKNGAMTLSALLSVSAGAFKITAQADGIGTPAPSYIFTFFYTDKGIRAAYAKEKVREEDKDVLHDVLTLNLVNISLGDIVAFLVHLVNPDFNSVLPSPLDLLYKIDLSKFQLKYDFNNKSLTLTYKLNLNLGIIKINGVGLSYIPQTGKQAQVMFKLDAESPFGANSEILPAWDLLTGRAPSLGGASSLKFELKYLGLAVRLTDKDGAVLNKNTILETVDFIEDNPLDTYNKDANFIFAADFVLNDALVFKLALADPAIYGFYICVNADKAPFADFDGFSLELFYKRISQNLGMFKASLIVPKKYRTFNLGYVTVTLGLMSIEIYTDGGFLLDLGFPHNADFSVSFVIEFGIFTGRGGLYFGILSGAAAPELPKQAGGDWAPVIKIGLGVSFGLGRSFDFGIVKGGLELALVGIFEGIFALWKQSQQSSAPALTSYYKLSATLGIVGRLYVSVNLVVIRLDASVSIAAYAKAQFETGKAVIVDLDFNLTLNGSVKILFIKVSFSYKFSYHAHFEIGENIRIMSLSDKTRLLNGGRLFTTQKITDAPVVINFFVSYAATFADNSTTAYKMVFVPMSTLSEFKKVVELSALWGLTNITAETLTKDDAQKLNSALIDSELSFPLLSAFLANNAVFSLIATPAATADNDGGETDGAFIPIPPDITLTFGEDTVNYATFNPLSAEYIKQIDDYFEQLNPQKQGGGLLLQDETTTPAAQIMFLDFFRMITRQIFAQIRAMYENYSVSTKDGYTNFADLAQKYGTTPAEIVSDNPGLILSGAPVVFDIDYIPLQVSSVDEVAAKFGQTAGVLWTQIADLPVLANVEIPAAFTYANSGALPQERVAAIFFARRYGDIVTGHYQRIFPNVLEALRQTNEYITTEWEKTESEASITVDLPGVDGWLTQDGDTASILAKVCALIKYGNEYPEYVEFVGLIQPDPQIPGSFIIPAPFPVLVYSAETPRAALRRVFASEQPVITIYPAKIIDKFTTLSIKNAAITPATLTPTTLHDFIQNNKLSLESVAGYFKPSNFYFDVSTAQTITLKPTKIPKQEIAARLNDDSLKSEIAAFSSRVLAQGLRLPTFASTLASAFAENGTIGFFELCGLQYDFDTAQTSLDYSLSANGNLPWISGAQSYTIDNPALPDPVYNWTNFATVSLHDSFAAAAHSYTISEKYKIGNEKVLRYIPDSIPAKTAPLRLCVNGLDTPYTPALCLPFDITRTPDDILIVGGMNTQDRLKLQKVVEVIQGENDTIGYRLLYVPSQLSGLSQTFADTNFGAGEVFIKTNLSRATKFATSVNTLANAADAISDTISTLAEKSFIVMLWECAVTCGNYYLHISEENKLPIDIFDKDGRAKLYLLVDENLPQNLGIENAALSADTPNFGADAYFYRDGDLSYSPNFAPGCYGLNVSYTPPDSSDLLQILSYDLSIDGVVYDKLSKPLIPTENYTPIIPVYKNLGDNPYTPWQTARVNLYCRDIFGNRAPAHIGYDINFAYNDFVIGLNEWLGVAYSYDFADGNVAINISADAQKRPGDEALAKLRLSILQLKDDNVSVQIRSSLRSAPITPQDIKKDLIDFATALLAYYEHGGNVPIFKTISFEPQILAAVPVFELTVSLAFTRVCTSTLLSVKEATVKFPPNVQTDKAEAFAGAFEQTCPGLKLANKNQDASTFFAVNPQTLFGAFTIDKAQKYYAPAPYANALINQVDLNLWAARFLEDFENNVLTQISLMAGNEQTTVKVISAKETLAHKLAGNFAPLQNRNLDALPASVKDYLTDTLREKLTADISSVCVYELNELKDKARFSVNLIRGDSSRVGAVASKLASTGNPLQSSNPSDLANPSHFAIIYKAFSKYETGFAVKFLCLNVTEFETDISPVYNGYENSNWYQFVLPYDISSNISPVVPVPNPLIEIPQAPVLDNSGFSYTGGELWQTDYSFEIQATTAESDTVKIRVEFEELPKLAAPANPMFDALSRYMDSRDEILSGLEADSAASLEAFAEHAADIANNWATYSNPATSNNQAVSAKKDLQTEAKQAKLAALPVFEADVILKDKTIHATITGPYAAEFELLTPSAQIEENKPYKFSVKVKGLSVYKISAAIPYAKIVRNSNVIDDINDIFVFQTEEKSLPKVAAFNSIDTIDLGSVPGGWNDSGIEQIFVRLYDKITDKTQSMEDFFAETAVSFAYGFAESQTNALVRIPVLMSKGSLTDFSAPQIAAYAKSWFNTFSPETDSARLEFSLRISKGERTVLTVRNIFLQAGVEYLKSIS
jgi:hypothetical protein